MAVHYTVSKITYDSIPALKINMEFDTANNGETILLFQDKGWGEENLHNVLRNLKTPHKGVEIIQHKDSGWITLKHPVDLKKIAFEYTIIQDTKLPLTTKKTYRPIIQSGYFHVFSHNLFMLPRTYVSNSDAPFNVSIIWEGFKDDYTLVNSFGTNTKNQEIKNTSERLFHSALFTGGDFRSYNININGNKVIYAIRGNWEHLQDTAMVTILEKTITAQRDFWKDHSQQHFTITTIPTEQKQGSSFQGTGLTNAFATSASNNEYLDINGLVYLFNHELQHNWIGHTIRNANEEEQYWFSEGFTDYYTLKNIAKNNINSLDKSYFIQEFNQTIKALYASPVKEAPNSEINYTNFWTNRDYEKLPYRRGAIFAFYLDNKIQLDSDGKNSLDDLLLAIKDDALHIEQRIDHTYFIQKANQFLKADITPFFTKHITEGIWFDLETMFKEFGYEYLPTTVVFDLGFSFSKNKKFIADIDPESNAYKAGLRKGDRITLRSYYYGRTDRKAEFKVRKEGKEISYTFFPAKQAQVPSLKDNKTNKKTLPF
jgi:predicted metalloprotease with PDZ domain